MSHVVSSSAPIASAHTVKLYPGFGILGSDIPTTGDNGGSPVLNDSPQAGSEYHWRLETAPASGTVTIYPDLTFDHAGAADGAWTWQYRLFEDGVSQGVATVTDTFGVTAQYARPTSDVSTGTWTASTGSDLFDMLDETGADDGDYITTTSASTCEVALGSLSDPASSSSHIVRYRISATGGGIIVRLREGSTTIASWTHNPAPGSLTTYAQTLSGGEADSIINYAALKLQFEAIA